MSVAIIILGAGGHAKVLIDALHCSSIPILGVTELDPLTHGSSILEVPILGNDSILLEHSPETIRIVNGLGSTHNTRARRVIFEKYKEKGYVFMSVVHSTAVISRFAEFEQGVQIMAGAVIQAGCKIGENVIVNTKASVDHDCEIAAHCHLAPGVTLSGDVKLGEGVHVGTGASVIQGVSVGANALIGAGSVVINDVAAGEKVMGVPARGPQL